MIVHGAGSYGGCVVREAHDVADAVLVQQRPVGAARVRHSRERDRIARDPVEVVGHAQVAEEPGVRAGREQRARSADARTSWTKRSA